MVDSGVPIMGHLGLTPQSIHTLGGFKVQAKQSKEQDLILEQSLALEKAGCFALVLECIPASIAQKISENLKIPTIGIGAGVNCDGQVLVLQDMLGMNPKFNPKFLKKYMNGFELIHSAVNQFVNDVETQSFPTEKESY
jgi:3-methyl-2-oxobutanoate hydroxymethyltransferase